MRASTTEERLTALFGEPVKGTRGLVWKCTALNLTLGHFIEPMWYNNLGYLLVPYVTHSVVDQFLDCCEVALKEWLTSPIDTEPVPKCFVKFKWSNFDHLQTSSSNTCSSSSSSNTIKLNK